MCIDECICLHINEWEDVNLCISGCANTNVARFCIFIPKAEPSLSHINLWELELHESNRVRKMKEDESKSGKYRRNVQKNRMKQIISELASGDFWGRHVKNGKKDQEA